MQRWNVCTRGWNSSMQTVPCWKVHKCHCKFVLLELLDGDIRLIGTDKLYAVCCRIVHIFEWQQRVFWLYHRDVC